MLKNLLYFSGSIIIFFAGMIIYGVLLNLREIPLTEAMKAKGIDKFGNPKIVILRNSYRLDLFSDTVLVKSYKAVFGQSTGKLKTSKNDNVTPIGSYKICSIDTASKYHKKLYLNFPSKKDAAEALKKKIISRNEFEMIVDAHNKNECPPAKTKLGADIGIQGIGEYDFIFRNLPFAFNWTNGSIAVSNRNIDEIFTVAPINTPVEIKN